MHLPSLILNIDAQNWSKAQNRPGKSINNTFCFYTTAYKVLPFISPEYSFLSEWELLPYFIGNGIMATGKENKDGGTEALQFTVQYKWPLSKQQKN